MPSVRTSLLYVSFTYDSSAPGPLKYREPAPEGLNSLDKTAATLASLSACVCPERLTNRLAYDAGAVQPLPGMVIVEVVPPSTTPPSGAGPTTPPLPEPPLP